jgi:CMP-N-acetylneuraminic acid synthetase
MKSNNTNKVIWAIIPARGGSKGILRKNIKNFCGSSLLSKSIHCLKAAGCFNKIVVTSDDPEILDLASKYNVEPFKRNNKIDSEDEVMTDVPVLSYLKQISEFERPDFTFMVQCTAPFMQPSKYQDAISLLLKNPDSTIFSAENAHQFLWEEPNDALSSWTPINHPFHKRFGRQFVSKIQVHETGAFYGFDTENFIQSGFRFHGKAIPVITNKIESIDINDEYDWKYDEFIQREMLNEDL